MTDDTEIDTMITTLQTIKDLTLATIDNISSENNKLPEVEEWSTKADISSTLCQLGLLNQRLDRRLIYYRTLKHYQDKRLEQ